MAKFPYEFPISFLNVYERLSAVSIGVAPVAARSLVIAREAEIVLGIVGTASRALVASRSAAIAIGAMVTAERKMVAIPIEIGPEAIEVGQQHGGITIINMDSPAEDNGVITQIELWNDQYYDQSLEDVKVGIFSKVDYRFCLHDFVDLGDVTGDRENKQIITTNRNGQHFSIKVRKGDYIGMYWRVGYMKDSPTGGEGWHASIYTPMGIWSFYEGAWQNSPPNYGLVVYEEFATEHKLSLHGEGYVNKIVIGSDVINRLYKVSEGYTIIDKSRPALHDGTLTKVEILAKSNMAGTKVGTFYGNGLSWTSRDSETLGTVYVGEKRVFTGLSIDVKKGDLFGIYWAFGSLEGSE